MPRFDVCEAKPTQLPISERQAYELALLGKRLASSKTWWGGSDAAEATVIECSPAPNHQWMVCFRNCIGLVQAGDVSISVRPKIPTPHFLYLARQSQLFPRVEEVMAHAESSAELWELILRWFVTSAQTVLRQDLSRGYVEQSGELEYVRGRILIPETALQILRGRPVAHCEYEEYGEDIPLNRVLRAAAEKVAAGAAVAPELRKAAKGILARMEGVGPLLAGDLLCQVDRHSERYRNAITFGKMVLGYEGLETAHGRSATWSFLIPTPEIIESGVRGVLEIGLAPTWKVTKRKTGIGAGLTMTPDLVFGEGRIVGDVKYKIGGEDWNRGDLYQLAAFGAAFRAHGGCLVYFDELQGEETLPKLNVGDVQIAGFPWSCGLTPDIAASKLVKGIEHWLGDLSACQPQ